MKPRFSIRTLLAVMVVVGVVTVGVEWTSPFPVTEIDLKGNPIKYVVRRTLDGKLVHVGNVEYRGFEINYDGRNVNKFVGEDGVLSKQGARLTNEIIWQPLSGEERLKLILNLKHD